MVPAPERVAELLREFAEPLLYADPEGPADIETLRTSMWLAMMCWNLPVYEAIGSPLFTQGERTLQEIQSRVPNVVAATLRKLVELRKTKFAAAPFLVIVDVQGKSLRSATIAAEGRMPVLSSKSGTS